MKKEGEYDFITIDIERNRTLKESIFKLFRTTINVFDKEKYGVDIKEETFLNKEELIWSISIHFFDKKFLASNIADIIDFCKKVMHMSGAKTLTARLVVNKSSYLISGGDNWSKSAKHIISTFDKLKLFYKEMINDAPFYIIKKDSLEIPDGSKIIDENEYEIVLRSPVYQENSSIKIRMYEKGNRKFSVVNTAGTYTIKGFSFIIKTIEKNKIIEALKKKYEECGFVLESIKESK